MVLREIIDEHLIKLIILKSFYELEHFQEDHWIIVVETMDKNPNPKIVFIHEIIFFKKVYLNYLKCSM